MANDGGLSVWKLCPPPPAFVIGDARPHTRFKFTSGVCEIAYGAGSMDTKKPHDLDREASDLDCRSAVYFTFLSAGFDVGFGYNAD